MKDLYSFHISEEDFREFYEKAKSSYVTTFERLGLGEDTKVVSASGGDFTKDYSHEFDTLCETGEDTIYYDDASDTYYNKEVASAGLQAKAQPMKVAEVGNIFPLGTKYSKAFGYAVPDETGKPREVFMGSYGIGTSRVMGVLVEKFHDDKGIIWPAQVAPFQVYLAELNADPPVRRASSSAYEQLTKAGIEVLYDDRKNASAGEKLADADLLGIPWRLVVSKKTGDKVEVKSRVGKDIQMMSGEEFIKSL